MESSWLPGLLWALPFVGILPLMRRKPNVADAPPTDGIPLSIVIPARNESATIANVLQSVLATTYTPLEVIVVDDRSTDDTAILVEALATHDSRLRLIRGEELPAGWMGKPWACHQGATAATGRYLLFTDADTTHAPTLPAHAVGAMEQDGPDLLTLTTRQECLTFWERIVMPQILVLLGIRYPPALINRATRPDQLVANGQYIMLRREAYDAVGGHRAVQGEIVEDLALAQIFLRAGLRVRMMFGETLISTRMYRSLGEMIEGWSKNLYLGARQSMGDFPVRRALAPLLVALAFVFWLVPWIVLATGVWTEAALTAIGCSLVFWALLPLAMRISPWYALGYPLGALTALLIALRSIWRGGRRLEWRGRRYQVG